MAVSGAAMCVGVPMLIAQQPRVQPTVAPRAARTSDGVILRDVSRLDSLEGAAMARAAADAPNRLRHARSAAYYALAREAYLRNDDGTLTTQLLQAAATGRSALVQAPVHRDLWLLVSDPRRAEGADPTSVARIVELETALVRAEQPLLGAPDCKAWSARAATLALALPVAAPMPAPVVAVKAPEPVAPVIVEPPPPTPLAAPRELRGIPSRVHFALDKSDLSPGSRRVLDALVDSLQAFPQIRIVLFGHTDMRASAAYNAALSRRRAVSVQQYLIGRGIGAGRMTYEAKGKSALEMGGVSSTEHARNRRVEMQFIGPDGREIPSTQQLDDLQLESGARVRVRPRE